MQTVSLEDLEKEAPSLFSAISSHEEVSITAGGSEIARIVPAQDKSRSPRPFGLCKGQFVVPDDFNDPIPELEKAAYGSSGLRNGSVSPSQQ